MISNLVTSRFRGATYRNRMDNVEIPCPAKEVISSVSGEGRVTS